MKQSSTPRGTSPGRHPLYSRDGIRSFRW